ncbi:MAG: molybdenum cofactor biosynthesis protein B [Thermoanaerobaculia bacterium]
MDPREQHRAYGPDRLGFAALTVSDSRTEADDASGDEIERLTTTAGHQLVERRIAPDEIVEIRAAAGELLRRDDVDVLVLSGGTGFSPRDLTLEAASPLLERRVEGFGELFRMLSFEEVGAAAMLSRAAAGIIGSRAVFVLPGSPKAVALAMERLILPEAAHLLGQARRT